MPRPAEWMISAAARRAAKMRKTYAGGRPKVLRACRWCSRMMGARELKAHQPHCLARRPSP
jgi:hypothetical protein